MASFKEYQAQKQEREWAERAKKTKESMGNAQRVERATEWKQIGNEKFKAGNLWEARDYYREAIIFIEDLVDARRKERDALLVPLHSNLAQVHLRLEEFVLAETAAGKALDILERPKANFHPSYRAKAHFRRGLARRALHRLEEACEDFASATKLQPSAEDIADEWRKSKEELKRESEKTKDEMRGFLTSAVAKQVEAREEKSLRRQEALKRAEERRQERRALAEQRQQMQTAFSKLAEGGKMLYEQREKEMEPVRKKEEDKQRTLELEMNLMNIIDESKGGSKSGNVEEFMKKKHANAVEQNEDLDQKKKILDKRKKEEQWQEDDAWHGQRLEHRRRLEARQQAESVASEQQREQQREQQVSQPSTSMWHAKEVARWCEQRLRDCLVGLEFSGPDLDPQLVAAQLSHSRERADDGECSTAVADSGHRSFQGYVLRGLVTDVLKLNGDATVLRLNPHKPALHYFDYFLKLDWEVAVAHPTEKLYRSAEALIGVAAEEDDGKAPKSVLQNCVLAGTFKIKEYCSEAESPEESWQLETKFKHEFGADKKMQEQARSVCGDLRKAVEACLHRWPEEYRKYWAC